MDTESEVTCDRCGIKLTSGSPAWRFHLTMTADTAQGMGAFDRDGESDIDAKLKAVLERIDLMPKEMLEDQIFQEFQFLLCRRCRDIVTANPLNQI